MYVWLSSGDIYLYFGFSLHLNLNKGVLALKPNCSIFFIYFIRDHITEGFEIILIGDFNINYLNCSNKKWLHLVELFDLKQMITTPTRVTQNTSSIIDHLYCSSPDYISDCFVPKYSISDHFPICFTRRKINSKVMSYKYHLWMF